MARGLPCPAAALFTALLLAPADGAAQRAWSPDARVIISDFSRVVGVAVDPWRVMAATHNGLIRYDPVRRTWELPLTQEDGYPVIEQPTAFAAVDRGSTLLLGTWAGGIWRVDAELGRVERVATVPGAVMAIRGDAEGNAYLRTAAGWFRLAPGSVIAEPAAGAPLSAAPHDPYLEAMRGQLELDPELRRWAITSWSAGAADGEYFIGTDGGGLARVDTRMMRVEWLAYGAPARGGATVGRALGRTWFGGDGSSRRRAAVSGADAELEQWTVPAERDAPRTVVHAILEHEGAAWFAAGDGLFRYDGQRWQRFGSREGLPSERITALASEGGTLRVGTERGLCLLQGATCRGSILAGRAVHALAVCGGLTWIGTRAGLFGLAGDSLLAPASAPQRRPVQALACAESRLYAATDAGLLVLESGSWSELAHPGLPGRLRALAFADGLLWVGGEAGLSRRDETTGQWSHYIVPSDIPRGPVLGILPARSRVWLATPGGFMRLELPAQ